MTQQINIKSNLKALKANLAKIGAQFNKRFPGMLKDSARYTVQRLIHHSLPNQGNDPKNVAGNTGLAKAQGEKNMRADINAIFVPIKHYSVRTLASQRSPLLWNLNNPIDWRVSEMKEAWQSQDMDKMWGAFTRGITQGKIDLPTKYMEAPTVVAQRQIQAINPRGVRGSHAPIAVKNRAVLDRFIKDQFSRIGKSVNGWVDCLKQLNFGMAKLMPGKGSGRVNIGKAKNKDYINISNKHGDPDGLISEAGIPERVALDASNKLQRDVDAFVKWALAAHQTPKRPLANHPRGAIPIRKP
jgi:hypothetical protein